MKINRIAIFIVLLLLLGLGVALIFGLRWGSLFLRNEQDFYLALKVSNFYFDRAQLPNSVHELCGYILKGEPQLTFEEIDNIERNISSSFEFIPGRITDFLRETHDFVHELKGDVRRQKYVNLLIRERLRDSNAYLKDLIAIACNQKEGDEERCLAVKSIVSRAIKEGEHYAEYGATTENGRLRRESLYRLSHETNATVSIVALRALSELAVVDPFVKVRRMDGDK